MRIALSLCSGLLAVTGCSTATPAPALRAPTAAVTPKQPAGERAEVCVIVDGRLTSVPAVVDAATGDTLYQGRRFREAFQDTLPYAARQPWYVNSDVLTTDGLRWHKFGLSRLIGAHELSLVGEYEGVPIFAERGSSGNREIVYMPARPGCDFHPYQTYSRRPIGH